MRRCVADDSGIDGGRYGHFTAFEILEEYLGMAQLVGCGVAECLTDREKQLFVSLCGIEGVTAVGGGFGYIRGYEIFLGLCAFDAFCTHNIVVILFFVVSAGERPCARVSCAGPQPSGFINITNSPPQGLCRGVKKRGWVLKSDDRHKKQAVHRV